MADGDGTPKEVEVIDAIVALLDGHKELLGLKRVYWGDQDKIPDYPAAAVAAFPKDRNLTGQGATHRFAIIHRAGIYLYHGEVASSELNQRESMKLAEDVEDVLHDNVKMGGTVIFGFVERVQPGFTAKENVMVKVTRLLWTASARENFN